MPQQYNMHQPNAYYASAYQHGANNNYGSGYVQQPGTYAQLPQL